ncbi:MAG: hypothetical protein MUO21_07720, partial [Nitrososphaeraceae archaeon]|nr:hypothetical protein [Nitrososphaeraceae archaeon]
MENKVKSSELHTVADCLNIEGGDPLRRLIQDHKNNPGKFLWANVIIDLDRPIIDGIIFETMWNDNRYPLLENRIDNLNEHKYMAAFLMIILWYIDNAETLINKKDIKITIHLHQDPSRSKICQIINNYIHDLLPIPENIKLEYLTDTPIFRQTTTNYTETDILISLSQCAGLSPQHMPGTLHIANTFYPFDGNTIYKSKAYTVDNDLFTRLPEIIKSEFNKLSVNY